VTSELERRVHQKEPRVLRRTALKLPISAGVSEDPWGDHFDRRLIGSDGDPPTTAIPDSAGGRVVVRDADRRAASNR
jgi:hypothetical protein